MRLRRLDLSRYGKFTDHSIDFGAARPGTPDLHIIYGLNEAGKSTTFSAFLDLLYGIGERSPYNFLHPYNTMKIGGCLEFDGAEHEVARLKQRSGSLVNERGQALNEALLLGALGGIGRDAYRTMFSLDDQSLKEGGNAIIQSKGELGELLFSASSGLAGLSKSLAAAADEANQIYKKRSSSTKLAELKRALDTLKVERNTIDTLASTYAGLKTGHDQADIAYRTATRELGEARARYQELTRLLNALPAQRELTRLNGELAALGDVLRPPSEWFNLLPKLLQDEIRLSAVVEIADRATRQLVEEIEEIVVDDKAATIAAHMDTLDQGRARYLAAEADLPKRRLALAEQEGVLARLLSDLEQAEHPDPAALLLPASLVGTLRDLIEERSGVDAKRTAAERELMRSRENLERLRAENKSASIASHINHAQLSRLEAAHAQLTGSDLPARLVMEERNLAELRRSYENTIAQLAPWTGDMEVLKRTASAEPRQIELWRSQAVAIERRIFDQEGRIRDLEVELAQTKARLATCASDPMLDDGEAAKLRAERDAAWQTHLASLDAASAKLFEARMLRDDAISASRLSRAKELAELRQLRQSEAAANVALERQLALLAEAQDEHDKLVQKIKALLPEVISHDVSASEGMVTLETWMARRAAALAAWHRMNESQEAMEPLRAELEQLVEAVVASLAAAGIEAADPSVAALIQTAADALSEARTERTARITLEKAVSDIERDIRERERDKREAEVRSEAWHKDWIDTLSRTWFADKAGSIPAVRAILTAVGTLPSVLKERQDLLSRVAAMERDQVQFREAMASLLIECKEQTPAKDIVTAANALTQRFEAAKLADRLRDGKQAELEKLKEKRLGLEEELAIHKARRNEVTRFFEVDGLAEVEALLAQVRERDQLEKRVTEVRHQIMDALRMASFDEAATRLSEIEADQLERDSMELERRIEDLTEQSKQLYAERSLAQQKLDAVGGDDAVARIEARRRTLLLEIEDHARRHLILRTGTLAADQALHLYRDRHRSAMMRRASDAFRLITGGNYSGLTTQPDRDREILIGVTRDGGSKLADAMSTGTQFQLYLALRLAGYEEFAAIRPPVPFVADDIMESFDNPRSEEVFRLLSEMAKVGQVIYLTHHWHLCEIAQRVVPDVTIHHLN